MKYVIYAESPVARAKGSDTEYFNYNVTEWDEFDLTQDVIFDEKNLLDIPSDHFVFLLPESEKPWTLLAVEKQYVHTRNHTP